MRFLVARGIAALVCCLFSIQAFAAETEKSAPPSGSKPIFDGKSLEGWDGNPKFWRVEEGAIVGQTTAENPTEGNTFLIWKQGELDDFELTLDYKIIGGNSGIQYRSTDHGNWVVGGYQADFESGDTYSGINYEERGRGILCERGQRVTIKADGSKVPGEKIGDSAEIQKKINKEDWNSYKIVASGNKLSHFINGQLTSEVIDEQADKRKLSGILALQLHAGPPMTVMFRDIHLKRTKLAAVDPIGPRKKLVLVAGSPSHGPGDHEFNAGSQLLKKCLAQQTPQLVTALYKGGWPQDPTAYDNADGIMLYMDGGGGHPVIQRNRLAEIDNLMKQGVGLACAHYAVEVPKEKGGPDFLNWIGGYFEMHWSVNPHWDAQMQSLPQHPITNGVQAFKLNDEWYYHMRFREKMEGVTPILTAVAPESTVGNDGPHSGNPTVRAAVKNKEPQHLAWAYERPDGGRGFGYTGGHFHRNWRDDNNRKLYLNALLWICKLDVPAEGVQSSVSEVDMKENLDPK
ncbi:MAG: family 16 glycoside hydrolase [Pirellulales bacterium]|nr:family 16 glycoside hydrolase [Pirellulales bacterium]